MPTLSTGSILQDRYEILGVLGSGGMGSVYKATQLNLNRTVAIKVPSEAVLQNEEFKARFIREGATCARVQHKHIVAIYDVHSGEFPYIVMEFVDGQPLHQFVNEEKTNLFVTDLLDIVDQTAQGLHAAHTHGIVHRDIKPANIAITRGDNTVKIMDFGIARVSDNTSITSSGAMMGTPYYMSPEQIQGGGIGPGTDQYALGCIVFYLLTGRLVFDGEIPTLIYKHLHVAPDAPCTANRNLPPPINDVLLRALAKNPAERYATILEFSRELRKAMRPLQHLPYSQIFGEIHLPPPRVPQTVSAGAPTLPNAPAPPPRAPGPDTLAAAATVAASGAPPAPAQTPAPGTTPVSESAPTLTAAPPGETRPQPAETFLKRHSILAGILIGGGMVLLGAIIASLLLMKFFNQRPKFQPASPAGMTRSADSAPPARPAPDTQPPPNDMPPQSTARFPRATPPDGQPNATTNPPPSPAPPEMEFGHHRLVWLNRPAETISAGDYVTATWAFDNNNALQALPQRLWQVTLYENATDKPVLTRKTAQDKIAFRCDTPGEYRLEIRIVTPRMNRQGVSGPGLKAVFNVK